MTKKNFTLNDFDFTLPDELIAQKPTSPRDHSRLLVFNRKTGLISDAYFYDIGNFLNPKTTLVVNNSKVEKARYLFGKIEIFVVKSVNNTTVEAMVRPGKKFKAGRIVQLTDELQGRILDIAEDGLRIIEFNMPLDTAVFEQHSHTPFPPYIKPDESLAERYQTVYAKPEGSKAAPTAGLHFTDSLLSDLEKSGIKKTEVTLHVGLGTFAPVKTEIIEEHKLHSEHWILSDNTAQELNNADHITAVGTTSTRVLESASHGRRNFNEGFGDTDIFIKPGYTFNNTDSLITNFHLPKSTLLMLVSAFVGYDEMRMIYDHAIQKKYRFYSFGDAMLLI